MDSEKTTSGLSYISNETVSLLRSETSSYVLVTPRNLVYQLLVFSKPALCVPLHMRVPNRFQAASLHWWHLPLPLRFALTPVFPTA